MDGKFITANPLQTIDSVRSTMEADGSLKSAPAAMVATDSIDATSVKAVLPQSVISSTPSSSSSKRKRGITMSYAVVDLLDVFV